MTSAAPSLPDLKHVGKMSIRALPIPVVEKENPTHVGKVPMRALPIPMTGKENPSARAPNTNTALASGPVKMPVPRMRIGGGSSTSEPQMSQSLSSTTKPKRDTSGLKTMGTIPLQTRNPNKTTDHSRPSHMHSTTVSTWDL